MSTSTAVASILEVQRDYPESIVVECNCGTQTAHLDRSGFNGALYRTEDCGTWFMDVFGNVTPLVY